MKRTPEQLGEDAVRNFTAFVAAVKAGDHRRAAIHRSICATLEYELVRGLDALPLSQPAKTVLD